MAGMLKALQNLREDPSFKKLSFLEKLGYLIEEEYSYQKDLSLERRIRYATFRVNARLEEISYRKKRGLNKDLMLDIATCKWAANKSNVLITGPTGTGKTYISCAIGEKCCQNEYKVKYYRASRLLQDIAIAKLEGKWNQKLKRISRYDVLIIDDWGLWELSESGRRDLLEVIEDRSALSSTVIASQIPVAQWHELLGADNIADAIMDRLIHNAHKIEIIGDSMRKIKKSDIK